MKKTSSIIVFLGLLFCNFPTFADVGNELGKIQHQWAKARYDTPEKEQNKAFKDLTLQARELVENNLASAEAKVWLAIILSTDAGVTGGFSALGKVKKARKLLEEAEEIDANVLHGSVYTSLGSLYYQVPGWPIGFGDTDKAEEYLKKALAANPKGIDPNYFYGDFLLEEGRYDDALNYLLKAQAAAPRADRPLADKGRQVEIGEKLKLARSKQ